MLHHKTLPAQPKMWLEDKLSAEQKINLAQDCVRSLRPVAITGTRLVFADGKTMLDYSSNDYLALSQHPSLKARAQEWIMRFGSGGRASRLITGTLEAQLKLEERLAEWLGVEAALIFESGWQANVSALATLIKLAGGRNALLYSDHLNHASLHAACALGKVHERRYHHGDLAHLESLLQRDKNLPQLGRIIVTETLFSMEGDTVDVPVLQQLALQHNAVLYLDDAHALGVLGLGGRGLASQATSAIRMGTFGKAFGANGAYIGATRAFIEHLISNSPAFITTTAPAPAMLGAIEAGLDLMPTLTEERKRLQGLAQKLRLALATYGLHTSGNTHIVPIIFGSNTKTLAAQKKLEDAHILAVAIRPPTVPQGSSRLRIAVSSGHKEENFEELLYAISHI